MAVADEALQLSSAEAVRGQGGSFEPVSDVGQVGDPTQIHRDGIERDEEAGEEKERHRHDWSEEDTVLKYINDLIY